MTLAEYPCPKCKKSIDLTATVCPFCQSIFSEYEMDVRRAEAKSTNKAGVVGCFALLLAIGGFVWSQMPANKSSKVAKSVLIAYHKAVLQPLGLCETATLVAFDNFERVTRGKITAVTAYEAVSRSRAACDEAQTKIATLKNPSGLPEASQKALDEGALSCFGATSNRTAALDLMLKILDGEGKPSLVNEMRDVGEETQRNTMRCAGALGMAAAQLGLKPDELKR
jgi:hypothetical protein